MNNKDRYTLACLAIKNYFDLKDVSVPEELRVRFLAYGAIHNFSREAVNEISVQTMSQDKIMKILAKYKGD